MSSAGSLLLAFFLSGASGLIYEVVWARQLSLIVGGTAHATQAVLATFFVGLTLGAFLLGGSAARTPDGRRFYGRLEIGIALAGLVSLLVIETAAGPIAAWVDGTDGPRAAVLALALTLLACLPATLLMGVTFAAVARALQDQAALKGASSEALLGRAYAANTFGAVAGSVGGAFFLLPNLGVRGTLVAAVIGNLAAAGLAVIGRTSERPAAPTRVDTQPRNDDTRAVTKPLPWRLALALLLSGYAAISLEIVALRVLASTLQDTVYTFALVIGAYIAGVSLTSAAIARRARPIRFSPAVTIALATLLAALWLPTLRLGEPVLHALQDLEGSFLHMIAVESFVALCLAAPAAISTTWIFITLAADPRCGLPAAGAGRATAWNGIGCALAPFLSALVLLPAAGTFGLAVAAIASLAVAALIWLVPVREGRQSAIATGVALLGAAAILFAIRGGLHEWVTTPGWHLIWKAEGAGAAVSIEESPQGLRRLRTNNNFSEGGDTAIISQFREGMMPTLFVPEAKRVLALGVGTGITLAGAVGGLPDATFEGAELSPEIRNSVSFFAGSNRDLTKRPNVTLHVADARTFAAHARVQGRRYDFVVGELFHAAQAGSGALYTREHFATVKALLSKRGVFCQWLPLHETPPVDTRMIVRTFFDVFQNGGLLLGTWTMQTPILGLVGSHQPLRVDWQEIERRMRAPATRADVAQTAGLDRLPATLAAFVAPAAVARTWAGAGPFNTDNRPELELGAPRHHNSHMGADNVMALLEIWDTHHDWIDYGDPAATPARQQAVTSARLAIAAFFRGSFAWLNEDLVRADQELRKAFELDSSFSFFEKALRDLATTWKVAGQPDRAADLVRWLQETRTAPPPQ